MGDVSYKPIGLPEIPDAVPTPDAGIVRLYARSNGELLTKDSSSIEQSFANITPTFLASDRTVYIRENAQMMFVEDIILDGDLIIDGNLIEIA